MVSILAALSACNKRAEVDDAKLTSLANKPRMLFLVFGDRAEPRALPIAVLAGSSVKPIVLDSSGWHNFDKLYFAAAAKLVLYRDASVIGNIGIRRGMWSERPPLYKLPNCRQLRPLAAVSLDSIALPPVMAEMLATSDPVLAPAQRPTPAGGEMDSARALGVRVSQREGITNSARGELDEVLNVVQAGVGSRPTIVGSYIERGSGMHGNPRQVFAIGDYSDAQHAYQQTFVHVPGDSIREFRRYIDHLDLTGDGIDEIVLEGWSVSGDSNLIILSYRSGHWREIARGPASWCDLSH